MSTYLTTEQLKKDFINAINELTYIENNQNVDNHR